jgi:hypothetical protein
MFRAANDYAVRQGWAAAMPNFHAADWGQGVVYGTFLFENGSFDFQDVPRDTLNVYVIEDVPGMMRAANDYAASNGYAAGFPTFHQADYGEGVVCGVMLLKTGWVTWRDVPASLLRLYSDSDAPWVIILCRLSDVQPAPNARDRWVNFFTWPGVDESAAYRYWHDVSYGVYEPAGSQVFGIFDIRHTQAELSSFEGGEQRRRIAEWGFDAARANGVPLDQYPNRIVGLNSNADHGATGGLEESGGWGPSPPVSEPINSARYRPVRRLASGAIDSGPLDAQSRELRGTQAGRAPRTRHSRSPVRHQLPRCERPRRAAGPPPPGRRPRRRRRPHPRRPSTQRQDRPAPTRRPADNRPPLIDSRRLSSTRRLGRGGQAAGP